MSYELWCLKDPSAAANPYVLLDTNSEASSAASATIQDAFATFGVGNIPMYQRSQAIDFMALPPYLV